MYEQQHVMEAIAAERKRQDEIWGMQWHHPLKWFSIIGEEIGEMQGAFNDYENSLNWTDFEQMKEEAVQAAATIVAMLECVMRIENGEGPEPQKEGES